MRCSFGSVTVNKRVFPGRIGRSPERLPPAHERFQIVPWPWKGPALWVTSHCTGKRRKGRMEKGIGASQGGKRHAYLSPWRLLYESEEQSPPVAAGSPGVASLTN